MSIYEHRYRSYTGELTPKWSRMFVLVRYGFVEVWSSKITIALFTLCLVPSIIFLFAIYLVNNPFARVLVGVKGLALTSIDANYFLTILRVHCWFALALTAWIAPLLIGFDLADNALPILLSRSISSRGYVAGKLITLVASLSATTWLPCLLLFCYQAYSSPQPWARSHLSLIPGLFLGALIWILFLSLLGLAVSAWVKWRMVGTGSIFAVVLVPAAIGGIISAVLRTKWGFLFNLPVTMSLLWQRLLGASPSQIEAVQLPTWAILLSLSIVTLAAVSMLNARIRACELVRG